MSEELLIAIAYFEDAVQETDEIIADCSNALREELLEQKKHFILALKVMHRAIEKDGIENRL